MNPESARFTARRTSHRVPRTGSGAPRTAHCAPRTAHCAPRTLLPVLALLLCLHAANAGAQAPLPDPVAFAAEVRKHLFTDRALQSQYTYLEHRQEISVSKLGKVSAGPLKVYEVYPSIEWGNNYKRLVSVNGVPLPAAELEKQDRTHREDVLREVAKRERETPAERDKRLRAEERERRDEQQMIDEVFALYTITLVGREVVDGHPTIVATLVPKAGYRPKTEAGQFMKKFKVKAWVSETEFQPVRVEAEAIEDLTFGWGIIGRLHKGAHGVFERRKINGEVWLPARTAFTGTGRALLFRTFSVDSVTTYSDYRKFNVRTNETFSDK